jgi:putative aldouronate transport system substrate-binding protein
VSVQTPTAGFVFDTSNVKTEMANLSNIQLKYLPLLEIGLVGSVDSTIAEYTAQAKTAGLEKVETELRAQLDAYFAAK